MIRVSVGYQQDGDTIIISWAPWWMPVWEFVTHRIEPCCGITGFLSRWDWLGDQLYTLGSKMASYGDRFMKERFVAPIAAACVAAEAIWPEEDAPCFGVCPYHAPTPKS